MSNTNTAMGWATLAGIVLVAAGLLGFLNTSIAGDSAGAILQVDAIHNIVHIVTGLVALYIAFGMRFILLPGGPATPILQGLGIASTDALFSLPSVVFAITIPASPDQSDRSGISSSTCSVTPPPAPWPCARRPRCRRT